MSERTYTRRTREQWQQHINNQPQSGLTIAAYCKEHGLTTASFYSMRSKLKDSKGSSTAKAVSENDEHWLPMMSTVGSPSSTHITLSLPGNITLSIQSH